MNAELRRSQEQKARELAHMYCLHSETPEQSLALIRSFVADHQESKIVRWIRYKALAWSCLLLEDLGRFDEALAASAEMRSLPASHYARAIGIVQRVRLLRQTGDFSAALRWVRAGLHLCSRMPDASQARLLMRELVRVADAKQAKAVAEEFAAVVIATASLPSERLALGRRVRTISGAINAYRDLVKNTG